MEQKSRFFGYYTAFGCFIVMFVHLGMLTAAGLFIPHMVQDMGVTVSAVSYKVTTAMLLAFLSSFVASRVFQKLSPRWTLLLASVICALHYVLYSYVNNLFMVYLAGAMAGIVMGFGSNACVASILSSWFIEKRAAVIGAVFGGAAFGGAVTQLAAGYLIDTIGWRSTYLVLAAFIVGVAIPINLLFIRDPKKMGQKPLGYENTPETTNPATAKEEAIPGIPLRAARKSVSFWLIMAGIVCIGPLITGFQSFAPTYWQNAGMSALDSAKYMSLLSILGALGTMLAGMIAEKFGNRVYLAYIISVYVAGIVLVILAPANSTIAITILAVALIGMSYPLSTSVPATVATDAFGRLDYSKICAQFMAALYLGKMAAAPVLGFIMDLTGSLTQSFVALAILAVAAFILLTVGLLLSPLAKSK